LQPGESLDPATGIKSIFVLGEEEALLVDCQEEFEDDTTGKKVRRIPGQTWLVYGPTEYIPPLQVRILQKRRARIQIESLKFCALFIDTMPLN